MTSGLRKYVACNARCIVHGFWHTVYGFKNIRMLQNMIPAIHTWAHICICIFIYVYVYMCICIYVYMYVYIYIYVYVDLCMYMYICICMYISRRCLCIHIICVYR